MKDVITSIISRIFLKQCHLVTGVCVPLYFNIELHMCIFVCMLFIQVYPGFMYFISQYAVLWFISQSHSHGVSMEASCNGEGQRGKSLSTIQLVSVYSIMYPMQLHYVCQILYFVPEILVMIFGTVYLNGPGKFVCREH